MSETDASASPRIAIVGLGARGLDWARVTRASRIAKLVGGADPDAAARGRAAAHPAFAGVPLDPEFEALASAARPDAVIVSTPAEWHARMIEQALALDVAVLVEKPFTLDLAAAVRLVHVARTRGIPLVVAQNYRYMRAHRTVRRLLQEGVLGQVSAVTCHYWRASHIITPGLASLDAAALWETGVHHLDALRFCLDRRVVGVVADISSASWTTGLQGTTARVLLEFEGGVRGEYSVSWEAPGHEFFETGQQFYERITGERGTLHVLQRWLVLCLKDRWPRLVSRGARSEPEEAVLLKQLVAAYRDGLTPECSGADNLQTLAVVAACQRAAAERRWINPQDLLRDAGA